MHGCMYAWMYVFMDGCMNKRMYAWMYVCMDVCMRGCMYAWMYVCMDACMNECMHGCMYAWLYACMVVCMHGCICMYAWLYVCMHGCMGVATLVERKLRSTKIRLFTVPWCSTIPVSSERWENKLTLNLLLTCFCRSIILVVFHNCGFPSYFSHLPILF